MPLLLIARAVFAIFSLAILIGGGYLLWSWYEGAWISDQLGRLHQVREPWRLASALALLGFSFLGRWPVLALLTHRDTNPTRPVRYGGEEVVSPTGAKLYVERHGRPDAPVVILTHGWGLDSTIWFYLRRLLMKRFHVITWDLAGLGKSRAARLSAVELTAFAQDLNAVLSLAGKSPSLLVGHSIGAMVIQTLIRDNPAVMGAQVAGLILLNTTYTNPLRTMVFPKLALALRWPVLEPLLRAMILLSPIAWLCGWQSYLSGSAHLANRLGFGRDVTRSQLEHTTLLATRNRPAVTAKGNLAMFRWDADGALQAVTVPVLVVAGDKDIVTKLEANRVLARATPGGEFAIVPQANHMGFLEQSESYNALIEEFALRCLRSDGPLAART